MRWGRWLKQKINLTRLMFSYHHRMVHSIGHPLVAQIEVTNHCPFTCVMCPKGRGEITRPVGYMSLALFKRLIDEMRGFSESTTPAMYGESLVHPDIVEMIAYAERSGVAIQLNTNPSIMPPAMSEKLLDAGVSVLILALDGVDEATSQAVRGRAAVYSRAVNNIHALVELKARRKQPKPFIWLRMISIKQNEGLHEEFRRQWESVNGIDCIDAKGFNTFNSSKIAKECGPNDRHSHLPVLTQTTCVLPWRSVAVMWDGRVVPCCLDYDGKYVYGDLNIQSLAEIWNGEKVRELRRQFLNDRFPANSLCGSCTNRKIVQREPWYPLKLPRFSLNFNAVPHPKQRVRPRAAGHATADGAGANATDEVAATR